MIDSFYGKNRFLSNFYTCSVRLDGQTYATLEHAYQAVKTLDLNERQRIRDVRTPGQAKRQGRFVTLREDWEETKVNFMRQLLEQKFKQGTSLRKKLDATAPHELIERNGWGDTFWGVCDGVGQNWLGVLLMEIRS